MQSRTFVIGTGVQQILGPGTYGALVQADSTNTADVYLGGQSVTADSTATGGIRLAAGASVPLKVDGNEQLWAVAPSGSQLLRVIVGAGAAALELG